MFRLEFPILSFFGVTLPGLGRPIIHFQHLKGSEVERRRETILRRRVRVGGTWGPWILVSYLLIFILEQVRYG